MKKGIIFDLDGTLWDSTETVLPAWNDSLKDGGCELTLPALRALMGKTMEQIGGLLMPQLPLERQIEIMRGCFARELPLLRANGAKTYPFLKETLETLAKDYTLAVVSNCQIGYIEAFIEHYRFEGIISDHECVGRTGKSKGENIALVCERNGIESAVYVGDTQGDLDAADAARLPFIWASYGFGTIDRDEPKIDSLSELPALVDRMTNGKRQ